MGNIFSGLATDGNTVQYPVKDGGLLSLSLGVDLSENNFSSTGDFWIGPDSRNGVQVLEFNNFTVNSGHRMFIRQGVTHIKCAGDFVNDGDILAVNGLPLDIDKAGYFADGVYRANFNSLNSNSCKLVIECNTFDNNNTFSLSAGSTAKASAKSFAYDDTTTYPLQFATPDLKFCGQIGNDFVYSGFGSATNERPRIYGFRNNLWTELAEITPVGGSVGEVSSGFSQSFPTVKVINNRIFVGSYSGTNSYWTAYSWDGTTITQEDQITKVDASQRQYPGGFGLGTDEILYAYSQSSVFKIDAYTYDEGTDTFSSPTVVRSNCGAITYDLFGDANFVIANNGDRVYRRDNDSTFSTTFEPLTGIDFLKAFLNSSNQICAVYTNGTTFYLIRYTTTSSTISRSQIASLSGVPNYFNGQSIFYNNLIAGGGNLYEINDQGNGFNNIESTILNYSPVSTGAGYPIPFTNGNFDDTTLSDNITNFKGIYFSPTEFINFNLDGEGGSLEVHAQDFDNSSSIVINGSSANGYQGQVKVRANTITQRGTINNTTGIGLEFNNNVDIKAQV